MTRRALRLGLVLALAGGVANAADKSHAIPSTPAPAVTNAPSAQVIAYYFHGTIRCETCLKIERQAREAIERRFKSELAAKQLVFKPENYDLPDNAHFLQDYKLPCPALVLVWQHDGKDQKWKLLGETWQHIENPVKFNEYVETEVDQFLREARKRGANGFSR